VGQQAPSKNCAAHAGYKGHDALSIVGDDEVGIGVGNGVVGRFVLISPVGLEVGAGDGGGRGVGFCGVK
jgi:hypothetical protein